jgi:hypothetical protein
MRDKNESGFPHCLHGGACAREEFEVKDDGEAVAAFGGDRFAIILEFEFLSRIIASMQSMKWRRRWRRMLGYISARTSAPPPRSDSDAFNL